MSSQASIDARNREFWNELCGTQLARSLGVTDDSPASLKRFDDWYFDFYPYLERHIPFESLGSKKVLEVGLGYGTIAQRLVESGAEYTGLDIAAGPIAMASHRIALLRAEDRARAMQGSVLECPAPDGTFDFVVAIGCYHHTGDLQRALDETRRVLKPGGGAMVMIYNAYSYRRWLTAFGETWRYWKWDCTGEGARATAGERHRARYDTRTDGSAAPETVFTSASHVRRMCRDWTSISVRRENIGAEGLLRLIPRPLASAVLGPVVGLDLYCRIEK
jgi:SAM-dependent methyltransferase